jgi:hypothetical protein
LESEKETGMKKILKQVINAIKDIFNRIIDEEAKNVDGFNHRMLMGC